jgi:uncharacterized SAM-binding protein YcdF (DUF218 family)
MTHPEDPARIRGPKTVSARDVSSRHFGPRTCLLVLLVFLSLAYLFLRGLGAFLIYGDRLVKSDAVAVLGGGEDQRVIEAAKLIKQKYGAWLILTEPGPEAADAKPASAIYRAVALQNGLGPDQILVTSQTASSTYEEARAIHQLMEQRQFKSMIVVTDPFHTERTRLIFRGEFAGSGITVRVHPVPGHWYRSGTWFLSRAGWGQTIREYVKMAGYLLGIYQTLE